jgi:hypothetical protein
MIININYAFGEVARTRCFEIQTDGELSPVECPSFEPKQFDAIVNPLRVGLGDVVAGATTAVGIKPCGGCARRKAAMNKATPGWVSTILLRSSQLVDRLKARVWKR